MQPRESTELGAIRWRSPNLTNQFSRLVSVGLCVYFCCERRRVAEDDPRELNPVTPADCGPGSVAELVRRPVVGLSPRPYFGHALKAESLPPFGRSLFRHFAVEPADTFRPEMFRKWECPLASPLNRSPVGR